MCLLCSYASSEDGRSAGFHASAADASGGGVNAAPSFGVSQVIEQLRTQWGGSAEGNTYDWSNASAIAYYIGGTPYASGTGEIAYQTTMSSVMQSRAELAFELWDDVIARPLTRSTTPQSGQIQFEYASRTYDGSNMLSAGGGSYERASDVSYAGSNSYGQGDYNVGRAEIWLNSNWTSHNADADMYFGGYGFQTYMHEIGHALGLSHPGTYDASLGTPTYAVDAEYATDTRQYTVMSYFGGYRTGYGWDISETRGSYYYSSTPMIDDISAIQAIYGADTTTRAGDTVYGQGSTADRAVFDFANYGSGAPIFAIWDGGGTDTLNASNYTQDQTINLTAGSYSSIGGYIQNIAIARNVVIENAVGGAGNDTLTGNDVSNVLIGYNGNDILNGAGGADAMYGGVGDDIYSVDHIGDTADETGGSGSDTVYAGVNFTMGSGIENLILTGGSNINAVGNGGTNYMFGNNANNTLDGGGGIDFMSGGDGVDLIIGGGDTDYMRGDAGNDTYSVDNTNDYIVEIAGGGLENVYATVDFTLNPEVETLLLVGRAQINGGGNGQANQLFGNDALNVLDGRGGADYLVGAGGDDIFVFRRGEANGDIIGDFTGAGAVGGDRIAFGGYSAGVQVFQVSATSWEVRDQGLTEQFILANGAVMNAGDYYFA